jgi:hypothetical protein
MDQAGFAALDLLIGTIGHAADPKPSLSRDYAVAFAAPKALKRAESLQKCQGLGGVAGAGRGAGAGVFA